jgi:hypothetical protein
VKRVTAVRRDVLRLESENFEVEIHGREIQR